MLVISAVTALVLRVSFGLKTPSPSEADKKLAVLQELASSSSVSTSTFQERLDVLQSVDANTSTSSTVDDATKLEILNTL